MDWLDLLAVQGTVQSLLQHYNAKASVIPCLAFFMVQLSYPYMTMGKTIALTVLCLVDLLCPTLNDPMDCSPPGSSAHGDSPGKNAGVGCHTLLHGIFPTEGSNPGLLHCKQILYHLNHQCSFDYMDLCW